MWSLKGSAGRGAKLLLAALVAWATSGCLRPLYGPTASGERLQTVLAQIEVEKVRTTVNKAHIAHQLRSELVFDLDGSGTPPPKRYKLVIIARDHIGGAIVDSVTGRSLSSTLNVDAEYTLTNWDGSQTITRGTASASASYERSAQRFAGVRAARDAEIRAAKLVSEQIKTRLAAALVSKS
jgi:LPS-assembly lipoprotein